MATPRYKVLQTTFVAPHTLGPGSIIEMEGMPGDHLEPLNAEAEAKMEEWYNLEYDEVSDKGEKTGKKVKPNWQKKPSVRELVEAPSVKVLASPKPESERVLTLAEVMAGHGRTTDPTDQRPGPAIIPESEAFDEDGPKVLAAVPPPKPAVK